MKGRDEGQGEYFNHQFYDSSPMCCKPVVWGNDTQLSLVKVCSKYYHRNM